MDVLKTIEAAGGFSTRQPVRREVEWNGNTYPFYFLDLPAAEVRKLLKADDDAKFVAAILCDKNGGPIITEEKAATFKLPLLAEIVKAGVEVIGSAAKEEAKND